jgi:hypothetical protein
LQESQYKNTKHSPRSCSDTAPNTATLTVAVDAGGNDDDDDDDDGPGNPVESPVFGERAGVGVVMTWFPQLNNQHPPLCTVSNAMNRMQTRKSNYHLVDRRASKFCV